MKTAVVTGADGSLGRLICGELAKVGYRIIPSGYGDGPAKMDLTDPGQVEKLARECYKQMEGRAGLVLINCAGAESIRWLADMDDEEWEKVFAINVTAPRRLAQRMGPMLVGGTILNITSTAARKPMRCSAAYNSSKAALEMLTRQMARELYTLNQTVVFGIAPNKLAGTEMSKRVDQKVCAVRGWTMEQALEYESAGRVVKEDTPPELLAEFIGYLLSNRQRHKYLNGCILNYGE